MTGIGSSANARHVLALGLLLALGGVGTQLDAQGADASPVVDLSGVERFLEITALLEQDVEPSEEQWDALFATPGYAVLLEREFRRDFFEQRFSLAFRPSAREELARQMELDTGFRAQFLPHYLDAKERREEIVQLVEQLRSADFVVEATARAKVFLPDRAFEGAPTVAFVVFAPDARGYDPVVIDILLRTEREEFVDIVAHEFHHWYRNRIAPDLTRHTEILWVLGQVQLEGIADLINIPNRLRMPEADRTQFDLRYVEHLARAPEAIRTVDSLLARMADEPDEVRTLGQALRSTVTLSGHPVGYYMARTILETLGRDAVVATVSNPFAFFRRYAEAARARDDAPPLSDRTLDFLRMLEGRYGER